MKFILWNQLYVFTNNNIIKYSIIVIIMQSLFELIFLNKVFTF